MDGKSRVVFSVFWSRSVAFENLIVWWENNLKNGYPKSHIAANDDLEFFYERVHSMAGKKGKSGSVSGGNWKGFANIDLRDQDKAALQGLAPSPDEILDCIDAVIDSGHKISITRKEGKKACVVSFTGQAAGCKNEGYTLSSFAPDFYKAFMVNFYKHHYIAQGDWSQYLREDDEEFG